MACNPVSVPESCGCDDATLSSRAMFLLSMRSALVISVLPLSFVLTEDNALPLSHHRRRHLASLAPPLMPSLVVDNTLVPFATV
jgi:hypothetical protein